MNLYVGNVDFKVSEDQISELFITYGEVSSVKIITDKFTGRSKGFCFVEMANDTEAQEAIEKLNGYEMNSRQLNVTQARPKTDNRDGGYNKNRNDRGGYNNRR